MITLNVRRGQHRMAFTHGITAIYSTAIALSSNLLSQAKRIINDILSSMVSGMTSYNWYYSCNNNVMKCNATYQYFIQWLINVHFPYKTFWAKQLLGCTDCSNLFVGLRPVIQILCHVMARGWGRWLRYFTEAKAKVKYRASARIRGPKHYTRFEWPVSILIMTRHPFIPFKTHKTSAKNPRLLTITGAIWFCPYRQCTPS